MELETKEALYRMCMRNQDVLLIDVMNHLHRYIWVHQDLSVEIDGEERLVGHIYGFTRFIDTLTKRFPNCAIVLALDGHDEERKMYDKAYKAQRTNSYAVDKDMQEIVDLCSFYPNVYVCYEPTKEADDVMYAVSKKVKELCEKNELEKNIYILSNDKDMFQCVRDDGYAKIKIIRKFGTGARWYEDADIVTTQVVKDKFNGVSPENLVKFRAIVGDSSDNLKGYYRFRKANASIIAENCEVKSTGLELVADSSVASVKWDSIVAPIKENYAIFYKNYMIMKLKDFEFELKPVIPTDLSYVWSLIEKYQLNQYRSLVLRNSPYRGEIVTKLLGD